MVIIYQDIDILNINIPIFEVLNCMQNVLFLLYSLINVALQK